MKPPVLLAALILAACTAADVPDGETDTDAPPADPVLRIGPGGAGAISETIPFTVAAAERAFPGYSVVSIADAETPAFHVRAPGSEAPVFIITPDWTRGFAGAVSTGNSAVAGPGGIRAGLTRLGDVPAALKAECTPAGDGDLICESDAFRLEFKGNGDDALVTRQTWLPPLPG